MCFVVDSHWFNTVYFFHPNYSELISDTSNGKSRLLQVLMCECWMSWLSSKG